MVIKCIYYGSKEVNKRTMFIYDMLYIRFAHVCVNTKRSSKLIAFVSLILKHHKEKKIKKYEYFSVQLCESIRKI